MLINAQAFPGPAMWQGIMLVAIVLWAMFLARAGMDGRRSAVSLFALLAFGVALMGLCIALTSGASALIPGLATLAVVVVWVIYDQVLAAQTRRREEAVQTQKAEATRELFSNHYMRDMSLRHRTHEEWESTRGYFGSSEPPEEEVEGPTRCPYCGMRGVGFDESPAPPDYCGHDPALVRDDLKPNTP